VNDVRLASMEEKVFHNLWKSVAPSKVIAFSWKRLHDRLITKRNLVHRPVIPIEESRDSVLCVGVEESAVHLFLDCEVCSKMCMKCSNGWVL
jgi:hypothetical protein